MKKAICILLCVILSGCAFSACSKNNKAQENDSLMPSDSVNYDELTPSYEFVGTYENENYTAEVTQKSDEIMFVTVKTKTKSGKGSEWQLEGYFSEQTYRVNYTKAREFEIAFDKNGKETERKETSNVESGRIQFSDSGKLLWDDYTNSSTDSVELTKQQEDNK